MDSDLKVFDVRTMMGSGTEWLPRREALEGRRCSVNVASAVPALLRGNPESIRHAVGLLVQNTMECISTADIVLQVNCPAPADPIAGAVTISFSACSSAVRLPDRVPSASLVGSLAEPPPVSKPMEAAQATTIAERPAKPMGGYNATDGNQTILWSFEVTLEAVKDLQNERPTASESVGPLPGSRTAGG